MSLCYEVNELIDDIHVKSGATDGTVLNRLIKEVDKKSSSSKSLISVKQLSIFSTSQIFAGVRR